jgi:hypothetical protein
MPKHKPTTPLAKADANVQADYRKRYPRYDADVARFGRTVADYNAGFLAGDAHGRKKAIKPARQAER